MTETQNIKVYELAKELGTDSISLLDRLRQINIDVKNHMSSLDPSQLVLARQAFAKPEKAVKPKVTKTRMRVAATPAATTVEPKAAPPAGKGKTVIRKSATTGDTTTTSTGKAAVTRKTITHKRREDELQEGHQDVANEDGSALTASTEESTSVAETLEGSAPSPLQKPVERKSFLKVVEAPPPPKARPPLQKAAAPTATKKPATTTTTTDEDAKKGPRFFKMTKENIDRLAEEEAAAKRGGRDANIKPEDVNFSDYRKKEMVFLPKRKKIPVGKDVKRTQITTPAAHKRVVEIQGTISVQDLANQMNVKSPQVIKKLIAMGQMATVNQTLDFDTASLVATEFKFEAKNVSFNEGKLLDTLEDKESERVGRPPVITVMGHVDHGKTSLLDAIRQEDVVSGEAGGITQHIGAYVAQANGHPITFIDTPGHAAFTAMRARGANITDIVILVVAADDGVMPQTREAVSHAKAAGVPIIVAVNKMDKPGANPDKVRQALAELDVLSEDWGGQVQFVPVSALKKTNLDKLLEAVLLQAEMLELKANRKVPATGVVVEAKMAKGRGPVATVLIRKGTLKVGDFIVCDEFFGRVKAMLDHHGNPMKALTPGLAAEITGLDGVPPAGIEMRAAPNETAAKAIAQHRIDQTRAAASATNTNRVSLEDLFAKVKAGVTKELNVIVKTDVFGSVEAVKEALEKSSNEKVKVKILHSAAGGITESDVLLASASKAIIIGFNVRPETNARQLADSKGIEIKCYTIIYELLDDVKKAMEGLLDKKKVEKFLGRAEVRETFSVPKFGMIAGSAVIDGKMVRGAAVRLLRNSRIVYEGKMTSLRRFKDDAKEVATGFECGIGLENYNDLKPGDVIEAFAIEWVSQEL